MTKLGIVLGSARPGRVGTQVAAWAVETAAKQGHTDVELIDLAEQALPMFDEPRSPLMGDYEHAHTRAWSARIAAFDAFVFVTPEYNRSMSAVLKNAIDYLYREWNNKAAGIVSYGSAAGGARAAEQLRLVAGALHMPVVRTEVNLSLITDFDAFTTFTPAERQVAMLQQLFTEVIAWANAIAPLRRA